MHEAPSLDIKGVMPRMWFLSQAVGAMFSTLRFSLV